MTHIRRNALFGIVLTPLLLAAVFAAGGEALDNPVVDTRKSECAVNVSQDLILQLPTAGRTFDAIAGIVPGQTRLEFKTDSRGRPTDTILSGENFRWDFNKTRFDARNCLVTAEIPRAEFGNGYSGALKFTWNTRPEERAYLNATKLRLNGGPVIRGEQLWFFKPITAQVGIPRPEGMPGTPSDSPPVPSDSGAPGDSSRAFPGLQALGGPVIRDRGSFFGSFEPRAHSPEECAKHSVNGVQLCVLGSGPTTAVVKGTTATGFYFRRTAPPKPNLDWEDGYCDMDGCDVRGSFFGQPLRTRIEGIRAPNVSELFADASVFYNEGRPNQSVIQFDYRATYAPQGSTQTTLPFPAVPNVPVLPPPAPPSQPMEPSGFKTPDGMLLNGTALYLKIAADDHANHEGHFFPLVGHYLCLRIPGNWQVSMNDVTENSFKLRLPSSDPRVFYEQQADCQRTSASAASCNWNGSVHGRDLSVRSDLRFLPERGVGANIFFGIGSDKFSASGAGTWK